jgi:hypothetical protein
MPQSGDYILNMPQGANHTRMSLSWTLPSWILSSRKLGRRGMTLTRLASDQVMYYMYEASRLLYRFYS